MSEPKLISPMLDQFAMGAPISEHHGVRCCPAMENESNDKYIVKVISVPATQSQMDALLLSGAYADKESALYYFRKLAEEIIGETKILSEFSSIDGFTPYRDYQLVDMEDGNGYDVYLLGAYKRTLTKHFTRHCMTHLDALNLGLDLCAALAVCRKSGYLYVDLKPSNIFVTGDNKYRIGDLGFVRLDSLKYASLPDRYLSEYTAPEVTDAFSALNTTIDIYAAGLILYQAYNNSELPRPNSDANGTFDAPMYADYEMSEIILKACAQNPEDRWQDPMQMGQAIISYMQRNGASDQPIGPVPTECIPDPEPEELSDDENPAEAETDVSDETPEVMESVEEIAQEEEPASEEQVEPVYLEDSLGNLCFLDELPADETDPAYHCGDIDYTEVSDEVSAMLSQADELVAMDVPDPVVVPEYVEVPIPEMADVTLTESVEAAEESDIAEESEVLQGTATVEEVPVDEQTEVLLSEKPVKKKKRRWLLPSILIVLLLALIAGGLYYYQHYYLLPIKSIMLEGSEDSLTVLVTTDIDESKLLVICSDTYGNQIPAPIVDGKAEFTGLIPDTAYNIQIVSNGFHRLIGNTSTAYSTPVQTTIVQFQAIAGSTDGSVILSFTIDGPDCEDWIVRYFAEGEESQLVTFPSHTVTITGLAVNKEYTFQIQPKKSLYLTGADTITFTPGKVVNAQNLSVVSFMDGKLTVNWSVKETDEAEKWTVRCYNDTYNETIITTDTEATFDRIDHTQSYQVEVTAQGMSVGQHISVEQNTTQVYNMTSYTTSAEQVELAWETSFAVPEEGWLFRYWIDGFEGAETVVCKKNKIIISPVIPGAAYRYSMETLGGALLLNGTGSFTVPDAVAFSCNYENYIVTADNLTFNMCRTPETTDWDRYDLHDDDYKTIFQIGEKASFLIHLNRAYGVSNEEITALFVIYDASGNLVDYAHSANSWTSMWYRNYCELDIPVMPTNVGEYTMYIYFNGALAGTQAFTVTA